MRHLYLLTLIILLTACAPGAPEVVDLPTLAVLPTFTDTATVGPSATASITPTPSVTPPPSNTPTGTLPPTAAPTVTPSATITDTPTPTPSDTPVPTETLPALEGLDGLAFIAARTTLQPDFVTPGTPSVRFREEAVRRVTARPFVAGITDGGTATRLDGGVLAESCPNAPPEGFGLAATDATLNARLGCPVGFPPTATLAASAYQPYERGFMLWVENPGGAGNIYAFRDDGTYSVYPDTWQVGVDPERGGETPPRDGLAEPIRGFGKVWRNNPPVRDALGWATGGEAGGEARMLQYDAGRLLAVPQSGAVYALSTAGTWTGYAAGG